MKVSKDIVEYVANLARLNLTEEEKIRFMSDMGSIISYFDKMSELDTTRIKPTEHVIPIKNVFREDKDRKSYEREKMLMNAPSKEKGCFKVPRIVG